jgi:hypothetical protein
MSNASVQRLQASRHAISAHLQGRRGEPRPEQAHDNSEAPRASSSGPAWWRIARRTLGVWWHNHPAYSAALVAQPVLARYARQKPLQVIGIAVAVGAAAVVIKPWRLISVGAVLAATLKSQDVTRLLMSLVAQAMPQDPDHDDTRSP